MTWWRPSHWTVLQAKLNLILANQATIMQNQAKEAKTMSALSDAVEKVLSDLADDTAAVNAGIAAIAQANANGGDVTAAIASLQNASTSLEANTAALKAALAAPTTPPAAA